MPRKKTLPLKKRVNKVVDICGRKFDLAFVAGNIGGQFHTVHPETGAGLIVIGDDPKDEYYQLATLLHELMESTMAIMEIRYRENDEKTAFFMDHDQFTELMLSFSRTLISTGLVTVEEPGARNVNTK